MLQLNVLGNFLYTLGIRMKGRGREKMLLANDIDEITRQYDGEDNPIGKYYTKTMIRKMVIPYFKI